jgi:hypothetical protein
MPPLLRQKREDYIERTGGIFCVARSQVLDVVIDIFPDMLALLAAARIFQLFHLCPAA